MRQTMIYFSALLTAMAFLLMGTGALGTLLGLRMALAGYPSWIAGLVMSAYFLGLILGTFTGHRMIAGVGHIRTFAALASALSAATLAHPFLIAAVPWAALRFLEGFCLAGLFMCTESWLNERASNEMRGTIFALYQITVYLAQGVGQLLLNISDEGGFGLFVITSILVSVAVVPVALTRVSAPTPPVVARFGFRRLYGISPLGMAGSFASGLLLGAFYGLGPYFAQQVGMDVAGTTQFMGLVIVGGLALQWPLGRFSDRFDRRTVICALSILIAVISGAIALLTGSELLRLLLLAPVFGGVVFTLYPLSVSHANDFIDPGDLVPMSAGLLIAYGIGAMFGPVGAAGIMEQTGPGGLFWFCALVGLLIAGFSAWRMRMRPAIPTEDQGNFQAMPRTTPMVAELDPRGEPDQAEFDFQAAVPEPDATPADPV